MARPREFDTDRALTGAMEAFWEFGFEGTSLCDLLDRTGLSRGSLYKAFGSKRDLYLRVLDRYLREGRERLRLRLAVGPVRKRIEEKLRDTVVDATTGARRGCFAVSAANEVAPGDPEVREILAVHAAEVDRIMSEAIERGIAENEIKPTVDPQSVAVALRMWIAGTQVYGRAEMSREQGDSTVDAILALIPKKE